MKAANKRCKRGNFKTVELASLEWVAWFNHHRLFEPIGYLLPAEAYHPRPLVEQAVTA